MINFQTWERTSLMGRPSYNEYVLKIYKFINLGYAVKDAVDWLGRPTARRFHRRLQPQPLAFMVN